MRTILLCLLVCSSLSAATFNCASTKSGNWSDPTAWTSCNSTYPHNSGGNLYTANVLTGHTVTMDVSPTVGTSPADCATPALKIGTNYTVDGSSTAKVIQASGTTPVFQGCITSISESAGASTPGYMPYSYSGSGGGMTFDTSLASSPTTAAYYFGPDPTHSGCCTYGYNGADTGISITATSTIPCHEAGNTCYVVTVTGGGIGGFGQNAVGVPWANASSTNVILSGVGTSTIAAIDLKGQTNFTAPSVLTFSHSVSVGSGLIQHRTLIATSSLSIQNSGCSTPLNSGDGCFYWSAGSIGSATKGIFDSNYMYGLPGYHMFQYPNTPPSAAGVSFTHSLLTDFNSGQVGSNANGAIDSNIWVGNGSESATNVYGQLSGNYYIAYRDDVNTHVWAPSGGQDFFYNLFDENAYYSGGYGDTGNVLLSLASLSGKTARVWGNIGMVPADPNTAIGDLVTLRKGANELSYNLQNNTWMTGTLNQSQVQMVTAEEEQPQAGAITQAYSNIQSSFGGAGGGVLWLDAECAIGSCTQDVAAPSTVDYNLKYNVALTKTCAGCTNQGGSYVAKWSTTPGTHDLTSSPGFTDTTRNLFTFATKYAGQAVATAWVNSHSYLVGDTISVTNAGFYGGAMVNYVCIQAHTSSSANEPAQIQSGTGLNWRNYWEPQTFSIIRDQLARGTLTTDTTIRCVGCYATQALINWVRLGYLPTPSLVSGAGHLGVDIGAVPVNYGWFVN